MKKNDYGSEGSIVPAESKNVEKLEKNTEQNEDYKKMDDADEKKGGSSMKLYEQVSMKRGDFLILTLILLLNPGLNFGLRALEKHSPKEDEKCNPNEFYLMLGYLGLIILLTIASALMLKKRNVGVKVSDT